MPYLEEALRELICEELKIPNIRCQISSDTENNDVLVENEKQVREVINEIALALVFVSRSQIKRTRARYGTDTSAVPPEKCDGPNAENT